MYLSDADINREAQYEARIEAAFSEADGHALEGRLGLALEALSEAEDLAGGLPDYYFALRKRWIAALPPLAAVVRR